LLEEGKRQEARGKRGEKARGKRQEARGVISLCSLALISSHLLSSPLISSHLLSSPLVPWLCRGTHSGRQSLPSSWFDSLEFPF
jgi:hypothetical protein